MRILLFPVQTDSLEARIPDRALCWFDSKGQTIEGISIEYQLT